MLAERRYALRALNIVLEHMPLGGEETMAAFEAARKDEVQAAAGDHDVERLITYVNVVIGRKLWQRSKNEAPAAPASIADSLRKWRDNLAASKPSLVR